MEKRSRHVMRRRFDGVHLPGSVWAPTEYSELKEEEKTTEKPGEAARENGFGSAEQKFLEGLRESRGLWSVPGQTEGTPSLVSSPVKLSARKAPTQRFMTLQDSISDWKEFEDQSESGNKKDMVQESAIPSGQAPPASLEESPIKAEPRGQTSPAGRKSSPKEKLNVQLPKARRWSLRNALSLRTPPATPTSPISAATSEGTNGPALMRAAPAVQPSPADGSGPERKATMLPKSQPAPTVSLPDRVVKNNFQSLDTVECMSLPSVSPAAQSDASAFSVGDILASSNESARWEDEPFEKIPPGEGKMRPRRRSALAKMLVCFR
jgi:hypothetical protein